MRNNFIDQSGELRTHQFISKMHQPIEALFSWINEQTGIQQGSKVRSSSGLIKHIFGRLSAAVFSMAFRWGFNF